MFKEISILELEKEKKQLASGLELLEEFNKKEIKCDGNKLKFFGVDDKDVYNISAPFLMADEIVIMGRVEVRNKSLESEVRFFKLENEVWTLINNAPILKLEDGFLSSFRGEMVIGGVETCANPTEQNPDQIDYKTVFYRGNNLSSLKKFASGPENMKDIRLIENKGKLGVFTRPQGGSNGNGKIGYIELNNLEELTAKNLLKAKIIENQFVPGEWGGANELHLLLDGRIGVIGHIAYWDKKEIRHYYATSFIFDPLTQKASPIKIIAIRNNFPNGVSKTSELSDIIFPGGLIRHFDGTATLYAGLSDAEAGSIKIKDPFI